MKSDQGDCGDDPDRYLDFGASKLRSEHPVKNFGILRNCGRRCFGQEKYWQEFCRDEKGVLKLRKVVEKGM